MISLILISQKINQLEQQSQAGYRKHKSFTFGMTKTAIWMRKKRHEKFSYVITLWSSIYVLFKNLLHVYHII